jgi:hypothetical protein
MTIPMWQGQVALVSAGSESGIGLAIDVWAAKACVY